MTCSMSDLKKLWVCCYFGMTDVITLLRYSLLNYFWTLVSGKLGSSDLFGTTMGINAFG